jgi:ribosomal protein S20
VCKWQVLDNRKRIVFQEMQPEVRLFYTIAVTDQKRMKTSINQDIANESVVSGGRTIIKRES